MKFTEFINENVLLGIDVIKIPKDTDEKSIDLLYKILRDNGYRDGTKPNTIKEYTKNIDIGLYLTLKKGYLGFDNFKNVDGHLTTYENKRNYKTVDIKNIIGTKSKYVKQLKWE